MAYYRDFREYLSRLHQEGKLRRISRVIDKDRELHPLVKWQYRGLDEAERFGFLFEQVAGPDGHLYGTQVASSVIAANREVYALALGCPLEEVHDRWTRAFLHPIPPKRLSAGSVKEEVHKGPSLLQHEGLREFPIPFSTNGWEAFPRITAAAFFSRDPDTGVINVGMYNSQVYGPLRANVATSRHLHLHWEKCRKRGVPLQVAAVIGAVPVIPFVAAADVPHGVCEVDIAGGLIGEPIELVPCETVDLEVPATAEVVIEGEIPTDSMDEEGPTGENRGHVKTGGPVHAFHVTCVTHRLNPIWHDIICQFPPSESSVMRSVNCEGRVLALLQAHGIPCVRDVAFHHCGSARHLCIVRFHEAGGVRPAPREVWHTLYTVMSVDPNWPKVIIGVDEDIDPRDLESVFWAVINRHQPHRDVKIIQGRGAALDESVKPPHGEASGEARSASPAGAPEASIILIDATRKWPNPPISLPRREYMEQARDLWQQLGLPPLKPRVPWHGVSLGYWPEEVARLVQLSEQGKGEEASRLIMSRSRKLDTAK